MQTILGIQLDNTTAASQPNASLEMLGNMRVSLLFLVLVRYHLVDVVALMEGVYSNPIPVPRSPVPTGPIPVC